MRSKFIKLSAIFSVLLFTMALMPSLSKAEHIFPTGVTEFGASQLVVWYDESDEQVGFGGRSLFQVTNTSTDTAVTIHVQIFADDVNDNLNRCREHDFNETLTPTDTVIYCIGNLLDNDGDFNCGGGNAIPLNRIPIQIQETRGFIVVTSVDSANLPRQAISHNFLIGSMVTYINQSDDEDDPTGAHTINAMGRVAVDVSTGFLTPAGVLLDGVTNSLILLQPSFLAFNFNDAPTGEESSNVVSIAFSDNYSDPSGEYRAEPATAVWDPLMYDQFERATSCQQHTQFCFQDIGLNDDWESLIDDFGGYTDIRLCPAISLDSSGLWDAGWVKIAVSGLSGLDNNLGVLAFVDSDPSRNFARWMFGE